MQAGLLLVRRPDHDGDNYHDDPKDDVDEDDHDHDCDHEHGDLEDDVDEDDHDRGHKHDDHEDDIDDVDPDVEPEWSACPGIILCFLGDFPLLSNCLSSLHVRCNIRFVVYFDAT